MEKIPQNLRKTRTRESRIRGSIYAVILCFVMLIITCVIFVRVRADLYDEINEKHTEMLDDMEKEIHRSIEKVSVYVYHLSEFPQIASVFEGDASALSDAHETISAICEHCPSIDQIRLVDMGGSEIVRVNSADGHAAVLDTDELRNIGKRYYFQEGISVEPAELYISELDLSTDNGEMKAPYKPVLRIGVPIEHDEQRVGLVLINFKAEELFNRIKSLNRHEKDDWYLIDENGFYLHGPSNESEFGFALSERSEKGLFNDYPGAWNNMKSDASGKYTSKSAWLFYKRIQPVSSLVNTAFERNWYLVLTLSSAEIKEELQHLMLGLQIGNAILVPMLVFLGWTLGNSQVQNKHYKLELENQARIDPLTGLYNRRHINELLIYYTDLATRRGGELSLVYVDLNNLKYFNDKYGHELGDIMIQTAGLAMKENVRKTDIVARMGGDEFMIVLPDCTVDQLVQIMTRVTESFLEAGQSYADKDWTMSWGSSKWQREDDSIADFISRADNEMYNKKKEFKSERR